MKFKSQFGDEVRRFTMDGANLNDLLVKVSQLHDIPIDRVVVKYVDDDGDQVTLSSEDDLIDAIELYQDANNLRLYVSESDLRLSMMITPQQKPKVEDLEKSVFIMAKADRIEEERKEEQKREEQRRDELQKLDQVLREAVRKHPDVVKSILEEEGFEMNLKSANASVHEEYKCDGCGAVPIMGVRYSCTLCPDYDICQACEALECHDAAHPLVKHRVPQRGAPAKIPQPPNDVVFQNKGSMKLFAKLVEDVSIPDRCVLPVGSSDTKIWRLMNSGPTQWPAGCKMSFLSGDKSIVDDRDLNRMLPAVESGETLSLELPVQVPASPGHYTAYFRLMDTQDRKFGPRLWVDFKAEGELKEDDGVDDGPGEEPEPPKAVVKYQAELDELSGMGFNDDPNLNLFLLNKFDGSIQRVVDWHLSRMK